MAYGVGASAAFGMIKDRHHAFLGTATGKTLVNKLIFENSASGFSELLARVEAVRAQNGLSEYALKTADKVTVSTAKAFKMEKSE
jgi:hypothetical protein